MEKRDESTGELPTLVSIRRACTELDLGRTKLAELLRSNPPQIRSIKVGKAIRIPSAEIRRFIEERLS